MTIINKLFSKKFADSGSPAYDVLKKMKLTNEEQEQVAKAIARRQGRPGEGRPGLGGGQQGQGGRLAELTHTDWN